MIKIFQSLWRWGPLYILWHLCNIEEKEAIAQDVVNSLQWDPIRKKTIPFFFLLVYELSIRRSSRSILYYRTRNHKILKGICKFF